jgi:hypothetical protein
MTFDLGFGNDPSPAPPLEGEGSLHQNKTVFFTSEEW